MKNCLPLAGKARSPASPPVRPRRRLHLLLGYFFTGALTLSSLQNFSGKPFLPGSPYNNNNYFRAITGKVTNSKNEPVSGASVNVKDTKTGTTTNEQGDYSINIPNASGTLVISHIGFTDKEVEVSATATVVNVRM